MNDEIHARPAFAKALGDWFVEELSEPRSVSVLTSPPVLSDDLEPMAVGDASAPGPDRRRRRPWLLLVNAALVIGALVAAIVVVSRPDTAPTSDTTPPPESTLPAVEPEPALPLPFVGSTVQPGRHSTPLLGVPVTLTLDDEWSVTEAQASSIALHSPAEDQDIDVTTARWIFLARLGGWNTPAQAIDPSFRTTGSIEPDDIDRWLDQNDVVVLDRRNTEVDGRAAIVIDLQVDATGTSAPLDFARDPFSLYNDTCDPTTEPCFWYRSIPSDSDHGRGPRPDPVLHAGQTRRMWLMPIGGLEPILIEAVVPVGDERWLDDFEATTIASLDLGDDAPPLTAG